MHHPRSELIRRAAGWNTNTLCTCDLSLLKVCCLVGDNKKHLVSFMKTLFSYTISEIGAILLLRACILQLFQLNT